MSPSRIGATRLFRFLGIDVFLDWSWFFLAAWLVSQRLGAYHSIFWNIAEVLTLFLIVLIHEYGHALACRQVGGIANEIVLWPFGGIAFARPPPRVNAELWTIAAGPLVNVVLFPLLMIASAAIGQGTDFGKYVYMIWDINKWLLLFNVLPIYPLDGGQILRSLLWFKVGRVRSLHIASVCGFIGIALLVLYRLATYSDWLWTVLLGLFLGQQCLAGYRHAQQLQRIAQLPRHQGFACPACLEPPPGGPLWLCGNCRNTFDMFSTRAACPHCGTAHAQTVCPFCRSAHPTSEWATTPATRKDEPVIDI